MKIAVFLLGVLADRMRERADESRKIEERWKERSAELEQTMPEPAERTVAEWEALVEMTGEVYYSIAAASCTGSAARHIENLVAALKELPDERF